MVSTLGHDCQFLGWVGQDSREPPCCNTVLLPSNDGDILLRYYLFTSLPVNGSLLFYAVTLPHSINIAVCVAGSCAMFRIGPQLVQHRMYPLGVVAAVSLALPVWYVGYIGPPGTVPWNNRFKLLVYGFVADLLAHLAGAAGWLPGEHPVEPRTSICLLYTSPSPRDATLSRMPSSA